MSYFSLSSSLSINGNLSSRVNMYLRGGSIPLFDFVAWVGSC